MSAATPDSPALARSDAQCTGPKTSEGKAISACNAVTHGLHAQETVLPHLGESQAEYDALLGGLARELRPRTAVEQHYVQQIAQAMWRLRRLSRWEAGLYDDPDLTDEDRVNRLARVLRHDAALRRHIDRAIKSLRDGATNCQNELPPAFPPLPPAGEVAVGAPLAAPGEPEGDQNCQNEPPTHASDAPSLGGGGASSLPPAGKTARKGDPMWSPGEPPAPPRAGALRRAKKLQQQKNVKTNRELAEGIP